MAATKTDIKEWFDQGIKQKATHLIVVCDTFEYDDYPVYATSDEDCRIQYTARHGKNMQRVMEVYNLKKDKKSQIGKQITMNLP